MQAQQPRVHAAAALGGKVGRTTAPPRLALRSVAGSSMPVGGVRQGRRERSSVTLMSIGYNAAQLGGGGACAYHVITVVTFVAQQQCLGVVG